MAALAAALAGGAILLGLRRRRSGSA